MSVGEQRVGSGPAGVCGIQGRFCWEVEEVNRR